MITLPRQARDRHRENSKQLPFSQGDSPVSEAAAHRKFYEEAIYPLLHPHQKVFLVPGAFATHEPPHTPLPPAPGPAPPPLPPANSSGCAACPSSSPYGYGNAVGGAFCCPVATTDDKQHCPAGSCCLTPGSSEGCQNVKRCGTNAGKTTVFFRPHFSYAK